MLMKCGGRIVHESWLLVMHANTRTAVKQVLIRYFISVRYSPGVLGKANSVPKFDNLGPCWKSLYRQAAMDFFCT